MGEKLVKITGNTTVGGVGTLLDPTNKNISNMLYNQGSYVLGRDLTFISQVSNTLLASLFRTLLYSGVVDKGAIDTADNLSPDWGVVSTGGTSIGANKFVLGKTHAIINGYKIDIIGSGAAEGETGNLITLSAPPSGSTRYDLIFLEFWFKEVSPTDSLYNYGGEDSGAATFDMIEDSVGMETARMVQLQWRIREKTDVASDLATVDAIAAWGAGSTDTALLYSVPADAYDNHFSVAGTGSEANATTLGTVDGYSYAFPLFRMTRASGDTTITSADITDLREEAYFRVDSTGVGA